MTRGHSLKVWTNTVYLLMLNWTVFLPSRDHTLLTMVVSETPKPGRRLAHWFNCGETVWRQQWVGSPRTLHLLLLGLSCFLSNSLSAQGTMTPCLLPSLAGPVKCLLVLFQLSKWVMHKRNKNEAEDKYILWVSPLVSWFLRPGWPQTQHLSACLSFPSTKCASPSLTNSF